MTLDFEEPGTWETKFPRFLGSRNHEIPKQRRRTKTQDFEISGCGEARGHHNLENPDVRKNANTKQTNSETREPRTPGFREMEELFQTRNSEILEFRRKQRERIVKDTEEAWESEDPKEKFRTSEFRDSKTQDKKRQQHKERKKRKTNKNKAEQKGAPNSRRERLRCVMKDMTECKIVNLSKGLSIMRRQGKNIHPYIK